MSLKSKAKLAKAEFQRYVRMRDADKDGYVTCCSCGKRKWWCEVDGGHFIPANLKNQAVWFTETNCHAQCKGCNNQMFDGEMGKIGYTLFMIKKYGQKEVDRLMSIRNMYMGRKEDDYKDLIKEYRKKQEKLREEKCLTK